MKKLVITALLMSLSVVAVAGPIISAKSMSLRFRKYLMDHETSFAEIDPLAVQVNQISPTEYEITHWTVFGVPKPTEATLPDAVEAEIYNLPKRYTKKQGGKYVELNQAQKDKADKDAAKEIVIVDDWAEDVEALRIVTLNYLDKISQQAGGLGVSTNEFNDALETVVTKNVKGKKNSKKDKR